VELAAIRRRPNRPHTAGSSRASEAFARGKIERTYGHASVNAELDAVVGALRQDAEIKADQMRKEAQTRAAQSLVVAKSEANALLEKARSDGEAAARRSVRILLATARREARECVLAAQRRAYDAVRSGAIAELRKRRDLPEAVAERLVDLELRKYENFQQLWT
jgi:vacuolar-type H+-ATPase subunit E/Vma4